MVGGGPARCAAYVSAARTGGFVLWIDRMTDWEGRQIIAGFASDLMERIPNDDILGSLPELWGSRDEDLVAYWKNRNNAFQRTVTWLPTLDPEMLKTAYLDIVLERTATSRG